MRLKQLDKGDRFTFKYDIEVFTVTDMTMAVEELVTEGDRLATDSDGMVWIFNKDRQVWKV